MIQLFFNFIKLIDVQKNVTIIYNEILNFFKISVKELMISRTEYILCLIFFKRKQMSTFYKQQNNKIIIYKDGEEYGDF